MVQFLSMKKIRINELARELEVKPNRILELLPELGVQEKKTHSSSIDEDVAVIVKDRLAGKGGPSEYEDESDEDTGHEEHHHEPEIEAAEDARVNHREPEKAPVAAETPGRAEAPAAEAAPAPRPSPMPLRPPLVPTGSHREPLHPPITAHPPLSAAPAIPLPP